MLYIYIYICNFVCQLDCEVLSGNFKDIYIPIYGANTNRKVFSDRCKTDDFIMLHGTINNYTLKFNKLMSDGSGCANIMVCKGTNTKGILYKIPFVLVPLHTIIFAHPEPSDISLLNFSV